MNFTLEELSANYNHFLPHILKKLEKEGVLKYQGSNLKNEKTPFANEPKIDFEELKKYQVVFTNKEEGFFSKTWKRWWSREDTDSGTYRLVLIKIITEEVYNED